LLAHIRQLEVPTLIKGDQLPDNIEQNFAGPSVKFADKMQDMTEVVKHCALGITNGSATAHFLLAGKPVLMMPMHIEQLMGAKAIARTGCGIAVHYLQEQHFSYPVAIANLTATGNQYQRAAQEFAATNKDYQASQLTRFMFEDIKRLLKS
jgi:UDP:flavonoid glycosyltransferase YjiC (YdhE family)